MNVNEAYMRRALQLAANGRLDAHPNPMVGAVIVDPDGRIIGEGWHRRCGEGHAEVNAVASVGDKALLKDATMYVTLEPCSHYGKTPPCARLIIDMGIPRVVVGCLDPFEKVSGRGVAMLREAGVEVVTGVLEEECRNLNTVFMTAHSLRRPYIILKWAESADGFIDGHISTPLTSVLVHELRAECDAIMVGSGTVMADNPMLDTRLFAGKSPLRVVIDRRGRVDARANVFHDANVVCFTESERTDLPAHVDVRHASTPEEVMASLYGSGVTSVLVEGGAALHRSLLESGLWDAVRIERGPVEIHGKIHAPEFKLS